MDVLLRDTGLNKDNFGALLTIIGGYVTGSAALYHYMTDELKMDLDWTPGDIDVFIPSGTKSPTFYQFAILRFMTKYNFNLVVNDDAHKKKYNNIGYCEIYKYQDLKIQFIYCKSASIKEIISKFDLSICKIYLDSDLQSCDLDPLIRDDIMNMRATTSNTDKIDRINKYKNRGFKIYKEL